MGTSNVSMLPRTTFTKRNVFSLKQDPLKQKAKGLQGSNKSAAVQLSLPGKASLRPSIADKVTQDFRPLFY